MTAPRVPLYDRLPEIYRIRDEEQDPPGQLHAFLAIVEPVFGAIHADIESQYEDLFVETAADWVVPYIGDLVGATHLAGDPWSTRADVAATIPLRRRKGTLGAIEHLVANLTRWGVHCVELRENLVWAQNLNHQRPDVGGLPPYGDVTLRGVKHPIPIRGGTVSTRDPGLLSLLGTPFDPFGHTPDVKPHADAAIRYNLPNLAIFLWRLEAYRVRISPPGTRTVQAVAAPAAGEAAFVVRTEVDPLDLPVRLFKVRRSTATRWLDSTQPALLTAADEAPGPILPARLTSGAPAGNPEAYVAVETYNAANPLAPLNILDVGLQLHLSETVFAGQTWTFRGANLCAWEDGLDRPLRDREVAVDPNIGRLLIGVASQPEADAVRDTLMLSYTYGAVGPVGAHPLSRPAAADTFAGEPVNRVSVAFATNPNGLQQALDNLHTRTRPLVIEIGDSMVHDLDLAAVAGTVNESGGPTLLLNRSVIIRASDDNRPIIRLRRPIRVRPARVIGANPAEQAEIDAVNARLTLRLEGLTLVRRPQFQTNQPLVARAAVNSLELDGCTLAPGGYRRRDGTRAGVRRSVQLASGHGFTQAADRAAFKETPAIRLRRTITGPVLVDGDYTLDVRDSIIDAGRGVGDLPGTVFAVSNATDPVNGWGAPMTVSGVTFFGRVRVEEIEGRGCIWVHALEVHNNQKGCIKFSYFSGVGDRLPQNHACVRGPDARLRFTDQWYRDPAYGQLAQTADFRIRERGPGDDQMGAFGLALMEAHKFRNLRIRFREFMPLGVRPLLITVT
ncbi:hypothetical protein [Mycolicibacterium iranicum]|uniref:Phage tail protein n=1 Tax=Mycolicibacterium iranicum TaxID=912594 RepID=A0A178LS30_MYCIR|nr:hypothetical protein [Mycolicibacterium iranicum]OAN36787.1 hypothetical protein A4X20_06220 [Mycolicibacterium iranicum]